MNKSHFDRFNKLFVHVFNEILAWEEETLKEACKKEKLTMREIHILEAVSELKKDNKNTMANIASFLAVSPGSCSTSVNLMVNKGFLEREYTPADRRVIYINLTKSGERINKMHEEFHRRVIEEISHTLTDEEITYLASSLKKMDEIFKNYTRR